MSLDAEASEEAPGRTPMRRAEDREELLMFQSAWQQYQEELKTKHTFEAFCGGMRAYRQELMWKAVRTHGNGR